MDERAPDPAEVVVAWETVEELLAPVPEGRAKDVLRLVAAGLPAEEIAHRLHLDVGEVTALAARGRVRVLTAELAAAQRRSATIPSSTPGSASYGA
jgi:DNA-directed RNA polymerase specialized sigma24 family protein